MSNNNVLHIAPQPAEGPDEFDRQIGLLDGLPDSLRTRESIIRDIPFMGVGGTRTFIVETYRQREQGDTIFLQMVDGKQHIRLVLPAKVAAAIARQRDQLTTRARRKAAQAVAKDRKDRGLPPAFLKKA